MEYLSESGLRSLDDGAHASPPRRRSPLHDFEHATKGFVDLGVLFLFGTVNASVRESPSRTFGRIPAIFAQNCIR